MFRKKHKIKSVKLLGAVALFFLSTGPHVQAQLLIELVDEGRSFDWTQYTYTVVATESTSSLTFLFRQDPAYWYLDTVSVTQGAGPNLLTNGDFSSNPFAINRTSGPWRFVGQPGLNAAGAWYTEIPGQGDQSGMWRDGAVGGVDGITQTINTTIGATYNVSFYLMGESGTPSIFAAYFGSIPASFGGINLVDANGAAVPEPSALSLLALGLGGLAVMRRRKS